MIIGGRRQCGKTTELIKEAHKEQLYIVCANHQRAEFIEKMSRSMGLHIPFPIMVSELPLRSKYIKEVLVDDVEDVLYEIIGKHIKLMSTGLEFKKL